MFSLDVYERGVWDPAVDGGIENQSSSYAPRPGPVARGIHMDAASAERGDAKAPTGRPLRPPPRAVPGDL